MRKSQIARDVKVAFGAIVTAVAGVFVVREWLFKPVIPRMNDFDRMVQMAKMPNIPQRNLNTVH